MTVEYVLDLKCINCKEDYRQIIKLNEYYKEIKTNRNTRIIVCYSYSNIGKVVYKDLCEKLKIRNIVAFDNINDSDTITDIFSNNCQRKYGVSTDGEWNKTSLSIIYIDENTWKSLDHKNKAKIIYNFRIYNCVAVLDISNNIRLSPDMRSNVDYVILSKEYDNEEMRKRLYIDSFESAKIINI